MENNKYPSGVPKSLKYPDIPVQTFLENSARKYPERNAVIFYGNRLSYRRLWDEALRFAQALREIELKRGDRVAILLPNVPQFIISYYGTLTAGCISVPINPLNSIDEINREIIETGAETLIVLDRLVDKIPNNGIRNKIVAEAVSYIPWHVRMISRLKDPQILPGKSMRFDELVKKPRFDEITQFNTSEDLATILFTSGTTGHPKGVMLTHLNLVANALQSYHWLRGWGYSKKPQPIGWPVVICAVPFFHSYGMTVALNESILYGSTLVLVPEPSPIAIMNAIQEYQATHFPAIPRFLKEIVNHPKLPVYNLSSLTSIVSGGAPISSNLIIRVEELTGATFYQGYGLTEASPSTHCTPIEGRPNYKTVGLPFPDTDTKVVDLQLGEIELGPGEKGELLIKGPQVMKGYWNETEATNHVLRDGWLHTGDIVETDVEGFLYIMGRKSDRIIASGHSIWPQEIEEILEVHPQVKKAVVIGVPDLLRCAFDMEALIVVENADLSDGIEAELLDLCNKKLDFFKVPSKITVVDDLPLTIFGKVDRVAVEAKFNQRF